MTEITATAGSPKQDGRRSETALSLILSIILLLPLFRLPGPDFRVNLPFKVELLLSLFVLILLYFWQFRGRIHIFSKQPVGSTALLFIAFMAWSGCSILWSRFPIAAVQHTLVWGLYLAIFLLFVNRIENTRNVRIIAKTFAFVACFLAAVCIFDYFSAPDFAAVEQDFRIRYVKFAEMLVTLLPVLFAAAVYVRDRRRMLIFVTAGLLGWIAVLLTLSKGGFVAGAVGSVFFFAGAALFCKAAFRKRILYIAAACLLLTIGLEGAIYSTSFSATTVGQIANSSEQTKLSTATRIFFWKVGTQMAVDHWLLGVGGDNFGMEFNNSRARYRELHPDNPPDEIGEEILAERAHNEVLQVFAELGIIGTILLLLPAVMLAFLFLRSLWRSHRRLSPMLWGACGGAVAFFVSSLFSSFSFRAVQNGTVFVMVLAVVVHEIAKERRSTYKSPKVMANWRLVILPGAVGAILLFALGLTKVFAEYQEYRAEQSESFADAQGHFRLATEADPEFAGAFFANASRASMEKDGVLAASLWRKAIDNGLGTSVIYGYLAKEQVAAGNAGGADKTYAEAVQIFPRSVLVRIQYAVFLEKQGRTAAAAEQSTAAKAIDLRQANGWYSLIKVGSLYAFTLSQTDPESAAPALLMPDSAVRQYLDPRSE